MIRYFFVVSDDERKFSFADGCVYTTRVTFMVVAALARFSFTNVNSSDFIGRKRVEECSLWRSELLPCFQVFSQLGLLLHGMYGRLQFFRTRFVVFRRCGRIFVFYLIDSWWAGVRYWLCICAEYISLPNIYNVFVPFDGSDCVPLFQWTILMLCSLKSESFKCLTESLELHIQASEVIILLLVHYPVWL